MFYGYWACHSGGITVYAICFAFKKDIHRVVLIIHNWQLWMSPQLNITTLTLIMGNMQPKLIVFMCNLNMLMLDLWVLEIKGKQLQQVILTKVLVRRWCSKIIKQVGSDALLMVDILPRDGDVVSWIWNLQHDYSSISYYGHNISFWLGTHLIAFWNNFAMFGEYSQQGRIYIMLFDFNKVDWISYNLLLSMMPLNLPTSYIVVKIKGVSALKQRVDISLINGRRVCNRSRLLVLSEGLDFDKSCWGSSSVVFSLSPPLGFLWAFWFLESYYRV